MATKDLEVLQNTGTTRKSTQEWTLGAGETELTAPQRLNRIIGMSATAESAPSLTSLVSGSNVVLGGCVPLTKVRIEATGR